MGESSVSDGFARGVVTFGRHSLGLEVRIPTGTVVGAYSGQRYRVGVSPSSEGWIIPADQLDLDVPVVACQPGEGGNAAPFTVCFLETAVSGVDYVQNRLPITSGATSDRDLADQVKVAVLNLNTALRSAREFGLETMVLLKEAKTSTEYVSVEICRKIRLT